MSQRREKGKASKGLRWSIQMAADEFRSNREAVRRGLRSKGIDPGPDGCYTTSQIEEALFGGLENERIRLTRADADLREMERAERAGELVAMSEVVRLYTECLLPIRQRLLALPSECATRTNPTDPQFSRQALQAWADEALTLIRKDLPKAK